VKRTGIREQGSGNREQRTEKGIEHLS
jgi:hypothetical protein